MSQNKIARPMMPGQKIAEIRNRLGDLRSYTTVNSRSPMQHPGRIIRPNLSGSVSITKITKDVKKSDNENSDSNATNKMDAESEDDTQVLDSDEEESNSQSSSRPSTNVRPQGHDTENKCAEGEDSKSSADKEMPPHINEPKQGQAENLVLTTDEKLPTEEALGYKTNEENTVENKMPQQQNRHHQYQDQPHQQPMMEPLDLQAAEPVERKTNLLKNYRHQRPGARPQSESSLTQLERTASTLSKESMPDFRRNLDDITQSYSPSNEERPGTKSKKKKSPNKEVNESQVNDRQPAPSSGMSHSVSSLLGSSSNNVQKQRKPEQNTAPVVPMENSANSQRLMGQPPMGMSPEASMAPIGMSYPHGGHVIPGKPQPLPAGMGHGELGKGMPHPQPMPPGQPYPPPANPLPDAPYGQYPPGT